MQSHLLLLAVFAFLVSVVLGVLLRDDSASQLRMGGGLFGGFLASAIVLGWLLYPFPL